MAHVLTPVTGLISKTCPLWEGWLWGRGRKAAESWCVSRQAPPGCRSLGSWKPGAPTPLGTP